MDEEEKPSLSSGLRNLTERERQALKDHPAPEQLVAYRAGELPEAEQERLRDHLAVCRDCAALLLDLADFGNLKPPAGVPELTDAQVDQAWQAMRSRIAKEETPEPAKVVPLLRPVPPAQPARVEAPARRRWLDAAAWFLIAGLGAFALLQFRDRQQLNPDVALLFLQPDGEGVTRSGGAKSPPPPSEREIVLIFQNFEDEPHSAYRVKIATEEGEERYSSGLKKQNDSLPLRLLPGSLEPGRYRAQLEGTAGGDWNLLKSYTFDVAEP